MTFEKPQAPHVAGLYFLESKMSNSSNSIQVFNFQGDNLEVVRQGDDLFVSLRAVCSALGLDHAGQGVKLAKREWATVAMIATVGADGRDREMTGVHLDTLPLWLATISPSRVAASVRPKLIAYQKEAARVLADHFLGRRGGVTIEAVRAEIAASIRPPATHCVFVSATHALPVNAETALRALIEWAAHMCSRFTYLRLVDVGEWKIDRQDTLLPKDGRPALGVWAANELLISRAEADRVVGVWGFEPADLYLAWTREGWAHTERDATMHGVNKRCAGKAVRVRAAGWHAVGFRTCPVNLGVRS